MLRNGVHFFTGCTGAEALARARDGRDYVLYEPMGSRVLRCRLESRFMGPDKRLALDDADEWCRVRAYSKADAFAHYDRAFMQWRAYEDRIGKRVQS